jgi:hypothetical protein
MAIDVTPKPDAERLKAFELFLESNTSGKHRSNRQIASTLGVSAMTIGRWREVDKWDEKVGKVLTESANASESTVNALKRRVRKGLLDGLNHLQTIATDEDTPARDRIAAVKALADIAVRLDAVVAASGAGSAQANVPEFDDTLEDAKWQTTEQDEQPEPKPADADSLSVPEPLEKPEPQPESLSNSPQVVLVLTSEDAPAPKVDQT